jgi:hypothetical protein
MSATQCEVLKSTNGERCQAMTNYVYNGRSICGVHALRIHRGWTPVFINKRAFTKVEAKP